MCIMAPPGIHILCVFRCLHVSDNKLMYVSITHRFITRCGYIDPLGTKQLDAVASNVDEMGVVGGAAATDPPQAFLPHYPKP